MFSILIKTGDDTYIYAKDSDTNEVFVGEMYDTKMKFTELLEKYPINWLVVVHNTVVTNDIDIELTNEYH